MTGIKISGTIPRAGVTNPEYWLTVVRTWLAHAYPEAEIDIKLTALVKNLQVTKGGRPFKHNLNAPDGLIEAYENYMSTVGPWYGSCDACDESGPTKDGTAATEWSCSRHPSALVQYWRGNLPRAVHR